jgi:succinate dehydrogenase/fumarate reductase flavoprotein subunit
MTDQPVEEIYASEIERGFMFKADTLEELATALGFEGDAQKSFLDQVARYNEHFDKQKDDDFGKEPYRLSAIKEPPFYGSWFGGTLLTTIDGISINDKLQVLDDNVTPIEGLYAVGDCSGSLFSGNYPEYIVGSACGRTLTFGRQVIKMIAGS